MSYPDRFATRHALAMLSMLYLSGGFSQAHAAPAPDAVESDAIAADSSNPPAGVDEVVVIAQRLNEARNGIQTQTGASIYTINEGAIAAEPGGDNQLLNQVIMQAPDVAQDSFGQFHVRGEHNGLQYRLNGIILPEGIRSSGNRWIRA